MSEEKKDEPPAAESGNGDDSIQIGLQPLIPLEKISIQQDRQFLEAFCNFEQANKYVFVQGDGKLLYTSSEVSNCCARNFLRNHRAFILPVVDENNNGIILEKPCHFFFGAIRVLSTGGALLGTVEQKCVFCRGPKFIIRDNEGDVVFVIHGPCMTFTCCCSKRAEFKVTTPTADKNEKPVGLITKIWGGVVQEAFTDADNFEVSFPADLSAKMKAILLGATILIDFTHFEKRKRDKKPSSGDMADQPGTSKNKIDPAAAANTLDPGVDWDALYDDDTSTVEPPHGSVISHLLSQVKLGMDLTKVVLPTFILERRSLLEMYADFFAHPDMFVNIADAQTPRDRIIAILRWYLGAFHAGRRSEVAKKPYNPILGETFQCYWHLKGYSDDQKEKPKSEVAGSSSNKPGTSIRASTPAVTTATTTVGTAEPIFPWVDDSEALIFYGEQVSHHPPISAFYAEQPKKKISVNAHIWTKSKFLGLSIGVQNVGYATLTIHNTPKEDYVIGFPNGYARSILSTPWVELGGPVTITCRQTGYNANVEFLTKPFFGGSKNKITAEVFGPGNPKKPFFTVEGEWNGIMMGKWSDGKTEKFVDINRIEIIKKQTRPIVQQETYESRRLWKDVTRGLKFRDIDGATSAKSFLEDKQRREGIERSNKNETWRPRMFVSSGDTWVFTKPLEQRLKVTQPK